MMVGVCTSNTTIFYDFSRTKKLLHAVSHLLRELAGEFST